MTENKFLYDYMQQLKENASHDLKQENVNHPSHYNQGKFETIEVIDEITQSYESTQSFYIGQVIKYVARAPFKGKLLEDLKKANWYLTRLIENLEEK